HDRGGPRRPGRAPAAPRGRVRRVAPARRLDVVEPSWVDWARRLHAIAQNGREFASDQFDLVRYEQVRTIAAEIASAGSDEPLARVLDFFSRDDGYATPK